jgi:hypothetical protein
MTDLDLPNIAEAVAGISGVFQYGCGPNGITVDHTEELGDESIADIGSKLLFMYPDEEIRFRGPSHWSHIEVVGI